MQDSTSILSPAQLTRRNWLKVAGAGGALLLTVQLPLVATKAMAAGPQPGVSSFSVQ